MRIVKYFRLVLVVKPLQYKTIVTKKRLHVAFAIWTAIHSTGVVINFTFFRKVDVTMTYCSPYTLLEEIVIVIYTVLTFCFYGIIMIVSYIIITVKLRQRDKLYTVGTNTSDLNFKVIKASWIVLTAFLACFSPPVILTLVQTALPEPYPTSFLAIGDTIVLGAYLSKL